MTAFYEGQPLTALYISVVSIAEIRFGIELHQDVKRRAELVANTDSPARLRRADFAGERRHPAQVADVCLGCRENRHAGPRKRELAAEVVDQVDLAIILAWRDRFQRNLHQHRERAFAAFGQAIRSDRGRFERPSCCPLTAPGCSSRPPASRKRTRAGC